VGISPIMVPMTSAALCRQVFNRHRALKCIAAGVELRPICWTAPGFRDVSETSPQLPETGA
jgi:hypothetical protein